MVKATTSIVSDYAVILGSGSVWIGDDDKAKAVPEWTAEFWTGHRWPGQGAILVFNVSQLTASIGNVPVYINDQKVGEIARYCGAKTRDQRAWEYWYSQTICFDGGVLKAEEPNLIRIGASVIDPKFSAGEDKFDDFCIKDMVCWYKQKAEQ